MNAIATQANASQLPVLAGWVNQPGDQGGTWPVIDNQGLWALESNGPGPATGSNGQTAELFGINDSNIAVGCVTSSPASSALTACSSSDAQANYFKADGSPEAFQLSLGTGTETVASSTAYGIDDAGDVVGVATIKGKHPGNESWYALCIKNCPTSGSTGTGAKYCYAALDNGAYTSTTTAYAISISQTISGGYKTRLVAGSYTEGSGNTKVTQGVLAQVTLNTSTDTCEQIGTPQTIDVPNSTLTVVRGVNNEGYIVGYFTKDTSKHDQDGFVGIPASTAKRRR
jgi:hypothetical protein